MHPNIARLVERICAGMGPCAEIGDIEVATESLSDLANIANVAMHTPMKDIEQLVKDAGPGPVRTASEAALRMGPSPIQLQLDRIEARLDLIAGAVAGPPGNPREALRKAHENLSRLDRMLEQEQRSKA